MRNADEESKSRGRAGGGRLVRWIAVAALASTLGGAALVLVRCPSPPNDDAPPVKTIPIVVSAASSVLIPSSPSRPSSSAPAVASTPPGCEDLSPPDESTAPLELKPSKRLRGADASSPAPWRTLRRAGVSFGFAAATHGSAKNPSFTANFAMMKRCGLPRGAYHFLTHKSEGGVQARAFLEQLGDDRGELPPALDVEKPEDCPGDCCDLSCSEWSVITRAWIRHVEARGVRPMIYTVEPFWNQCLCGTKKEGARPLWLAGWPRFDFPEAVRFGGFSRWTFYQYAGNVRVGGGVVDLNLFRGGPAELDAFIRAGEPPAGD